MYWFQIKTFVKANCCRQIVFLDTFRCIQTAWTYHEITLSSYTSTAFILIKQGSYKEMIAYSFIPYGERNNSLTSVWRGTSWTSFVSCFPLHASFCSIATVTSRALPDYCCLMYKLYSSNYINLTSFYSSSTLTGTWAECRHSNTVCYLHWEQRNAGFGQT